MSEYIVEQKTEGSILILNFAMNISLEILKMCLASCCVLL